MNTFTKNIITTLLALTLLSFTNQASAGFFDSLIEDIIEIGSDNTILSAPQENVKGYKKTDNTETDQRLLAESEIYNAIEKNNAVKKIGFEWTITKKLIKEARHSVKMGDFVKAEKLAKKAIRYVNYGYEQAETSKTAGPRF